MEEANGSAGEAGFLSQTKIDLNHASLAELMTIRGIGRIKAQAIIDHRSQSPFLSVQDLIRVMTSGRPAFSARFIEANEDRFTVK